MTETRQHLSRSINYLGELGARLRDLQGFATLAHELVQNADDAEGASAISFDVRRDSLVVDNDGIFSSCGQVEAEGCVWQSDPERQHMCDFHRFRTVASADKRQQLETTGAFGIGFIAVYQITDRPELISGGRHWILHEEAPEDRRIEVCPGCSACTQGNLPGTRFVLPWVLDANSDLRTKLRADPVSAGGPAQLLDELGQIVPHALVFLKHIDVIDLRQEGVVVARFERIVEGDAVIISGGPKDIVWHLFRGEFGQVAEGLRQTYPGRIEDKRKARIRVAFPDEPIPMGLLYATLPTQHDTGLQFHVDAEFFPTGDRKRIIFESGFQREWNRAAIHAAAEVFGGCLGALTAQLSPTRLWKILESARVAEEPANANRDESLSDFWRRALPLLPNLKIVYSTRGEWHRPSEVLLSEREEPVPILERLGIPIVHGDLRPHFTLLRRSEVGVRLLDVPDVVEALCACGLTKRTEKAALPECLCEEDGIQVLWSELSQLLSRKRKSEEQRGQEVALARCAIAQGRDGAFWPCEAVYRADEKTVALFSRISPDIPFAATLPEEARAVERLCPEFSVGAAAKELGRFTAADFTQAREEGRFNPAVLLAWFESRRDAVFGSADSREALRRLPVFPSSEGLKPLTDLALPGDFEDPIGLADLLDIGALRERREFLRDLGAKELTFEQYALRFVSRAFNNPEIPVEKKQKATRLLGVRLGEIRGNHEVRQALVEAAIVECADGTYRLPRSVYLPSETVTRVLGDNARTAVLPAADFEPVMEFYRWLGVEEQPRYEDVVERIKSLTTGPPDAASTREIQTVFEHLGMRLQRSDQGTDALLELQSMFWLPARVDTSHWYGPQDVYAVFRDYLFESQAKFLDVARGIQTASGNLLEFLGIQSNPKPSMVVQHLLHCVEEGLAVNKEVYSFLNEHALDPAIKRLRGQPCLLLPDNTYVKPSQVYWGEHQFGKYRHRLGSDLRRYADLFESIGVKEAPDHDDALQVIDEISRQFGALNLSLDDDTYAVVMVCWQLLSKALESNQVTDGDLEGLHDGKVIPNLGHLLMPPCRMFFEDRAGLTAKFGEVLRCHVIPRPQGAWRAMVTAGVRPLASAVTSELVECQDAAEDEMVCGRLQERRLHLARVLESQGDEVNGGNAIAVLDKLSCQAVGQLRVRWTLPDFRGLAGEPESVPAHYHRESQALYYVKHDDGLPWASIARELALAICPEIEPGRLASGIKEVLVAESSEQAGTVLDELGFATLQVPPAGRAGIEVRDLGGETAPIGEPSVPPAGGKSPTKGAPAPGEVGGAVSPTSPAGPTQGEGAPGTTGGKPSAPSTPTPSSDTRKQGQFRTYVTTDKGGEVEAGDDWSKKRTDVGRAGVARVMEYENSKGRHARDMEVKRANYPGYDVESFGEAGNVVRYIEVKSCAGLWGTRGVGLSKTQFDMAHELGDRYWLYVVERAQRADFRIYRIQDPARMVNQYLYDYGWQHAAEEDEGGRM